MGWGNCSKVRQHSGDLNSPGQDSVLQEGRFSGNTVERYQNYDRTKRFMHTRKLRVDAADVSAPLGSFSACSAAYVSGTKRLAPPTRQKLG